MSVVYNPEAETIARIEGLELEVRMLRRKLESAKNPSDKKVINRQIAELKDEIHFLANQLDRVGGR